MSAKEDFLEFTQLLVEDMSLNKWENNNLVDYLESINSWVDTLKI